MTSPRVLRQLFRTILRDAKKLSKDERKISTALRNGTARISSDSVGASAFQNGIQNLGRVGMLEEAIKARFRVHGSMRDDGANDFNPTQGGGTCGPRNKNTDMESTGVDKAFQVVYQLNTIRGALHCLEDSGAFDSLGRHILHMKDNCYSEHQVLSGNSRQSCNGAVASRPVRSNLYDPLFVVGEFVHHWCHGPALVFGWECESKEIQSVCGECADSSGLAFINQLKYFERVENRESTKMIVEDCISINSGYVVHDNKKGLRPREYLASTATCSNARQPYYYRLILPGGETTLVPEKSLTKHSWDICDYNVHESSYWKAIDNVRQLYASMHPLCNYYFKGLNKNPSLEDGSFKQYAIPRKELQQRYPDDFSSIRISE